MDLFGSPDDDSGWQPRTNADFGEFLLDAFRQVGSRPAGVPAERSGPPELGEDIHDVRVASGRGAPVTLPIGRESKQLDLHDERNLADLEDPGLVEHMRVARQSWLTQQRERTAPPAPEVLAQKDVTARRALSELVVAMQALTMEMQCACEGVWLQASNAKRLAAGERPHGFPEEGAEFTLGSPHGKNLSHLAKKLTESGDELSKLVTGFAQFERSLTLARRNYEEVTDGLARFRAAAEP